MAKPPSILALNPPLYSFRTSLFAGVATLIAAGCSSSSGDPAATDGPTGDGSLGTTGTSSGTPSTGSGSGPTTTAASSAGPTTTGPGATTAGATSTSGTSGGSVGTGDTGSGTITTTTATGSDTANASTTGSGGASGGAGGTGSGTTSATTGSGGGPTVTCPTEVMQSGDSTQQVQVGSLNRSYLLHIPTGYTGTEPLALVIDFHPLGGTGAQQANSNGWKAKADSVGFITAYPDSYNSNNSWNVGMCCMDAQANQIDDVGFTKAMIEQISEIACLDPTRVYATGCSNGGGMTYKVACDLADMVAGAAPVDFRCVYGGSTNEPSCEGCMPSRPISITHFDNTGDNALVPYNGGLTSFPADCPPGQSCTGMGFPSAAENFSTWQTINECTGSAAALEGHSECQTNSACGGGAQTTMCVQQGGSHCGNYSSLGIVDTAWEMFEGQSL